MSEKEFCVYIMASKPYGVLYIGVTSNLIQRVSQHKRGTFKGFTKKYHVKKLVYYEMYDDAESAFTREKKLKKWKRSLKINLIEEKNPEWLDLFPLFFKPMTPA